MKGEILRFYGYQNLIPALQNLISARSVLISALSKFAICDYQNLTTENIVIEYSINDSILLQADEPLVDEKKEEVSFFKRFLT